MEGHGWSLHKGECSCECVRHAAVRYSALCSPPCLRDLPCVPLVLGLVLGFALFSLGRALRWSVGTAWRRSLGFTFARWRTLRLGVGPIGWWALRFCFGRFLWLGLRRLRSW